MKEKEFTSYSFTRIVLAALHFNENVRRGTATKRNGEPCKKISYSKHKLSEEIVRDIGIPPSYGKNDVNFPLFYVEGKSVPLSFNIKTSSK